MFSWKKRIYADAAAATPLSALALAELVRLLPLYGNPGSLHTEATAAKEELERARAGAAAAVGAHADEIVFTASGTEANNLALKGVLVPLLHTRESVHVVTSAIEHPSVLEPLRALEREGMRLTMLPVDGAGLVDPAALAQAITDDTVLVSVQLINSEVGTIQPIREIAKEIRRIKKIRASQTYPSLGKSDLPKFPKPLYLHIDAAQAPLWLPLAVEKLGVDLMTLDGQKILGPKGVGMLYVKRGVPMEPLLHGGGQEAGRRSGTENLPLVGAFAVALADAQKKAAVHAKAVGAVRDFLWQAIQQQLPSAVLHGTPCGPLRVANNLNISIPGLDGQMAVLALDAQGIAASTRSACSTAEEETSHVLAALGVSVADAKTAIRLTLLPTATKRQASQIARTLASVAARYRV